MTNKENRRFWLLLAVLVFAVMLLAACTGQNQAQDSAKDQSAKDAAPAPGQAGFQEFPMGDEKQAEGMTVAGVYFQAVEMEPAEKAGLSLADADIHIEADIHALKNNKAGFGNGEWIPNLTVGYKVRNLGDGTEQGGTLMPMNASDGPHYGANIKMGGAGKYRVAFSIESPERQGYLLHVDRETGVPGRFWKKPIDVSWDFDYVPLKK